MDEITWINHAGFQLRSGAISLVCDPWLSGSAFGNGWNLLSPTRFTAEQLGQATHFWLSHEHPDHFSPHDLRSVPAEQRPKITILFQHTRDRRVAKFCESLNFRVLELSPLTPLDLGGVSVTIDVVHIVLYPGETWTGGSHDSIRSIHRYEADAAQKAPLHKARKVSWQDLEAAGVSFAARTRMPMGR